MAGSNGKRCWMAAGAAFVVLNALEFFWHHVVLRSTYKSAQYLTLWNPEPTMQSRMWAMWVTFAVASVLFTTIYSKGYEPGKPALGQGLRCGLLVGALLGVWGGLLAFFIYPVSLGLALAWTGATVVDFAAMGAVAALLYKPQAQ
jgi:hypothetical protein